VAQNCALETSKREFDQILRENQKQAEDVNEHITLENESLKLENKKLGQENEAFR
jgi:hypothetical protein